MQYGECLVVPCPLSFANSAPSPHCPVRVSGEEFVEEGIHLKDLPTLVKAIQDSGAAYISVSAGVYDIHDRIMPDRHAGDGVYAYLGRAAKAVAEIPILLSGNVGSLPMVQRLLSEDCADMVLMGRALLADPWLLQKSLRGDEQAIQPCTMCRICKYHSRGLPHISCPHNDLLWNLLRTTVRETKGDTGRIKLKPLPNRNAKIDGCATPS